jgi:hypothetical protein
MKVVCIKHFKSQGLQYELTYGKAYDVLEVPKWATDAVIHIMNDRGFKSLYSISCFVELEEWRDKKLKLIGI